MSREARDTVEGALDELGVLDSLDVDDVPSSVDVTDELYVENLGERTELVQRNEGASDSRIILDNDTALLLGYVLEVACRDV